MKLIGEPSAGGAFYHIKQNSNKGTLPKLIQKYKNAYKIALEKVNDKRPKWFILFIFINRKKECCWKVFDDIAEINEAEFVESKFKRENLT